MALDLVPDPTARRAGETDWRRYSSTREGTAIQANQRLTMPACSARVRHRDTSPRPRMRAGANNLAVGQMDLVELPVVDRPVGELGEIEADSRRRSDLLGLRTHEVEVARVSLSVGTLLEEVEEGGSSLEGDVTVRMELRRNCGVVD